MFFFDLWQLHDSYLNTRVRIESPIVGLQVPGLMGRANMMSKDAMIHQRYYHDQSSIINHQRSTIHHQSSFIIILIMINDLSSIAMTVVTGAYWWLLFIPISIWIYTNMDLYQYQLSIRYVVTIGLCPCKTCLAAVACGRNMLPSPSQPCWHAISRHGSMEMVKKTRQIWPGLLSQHTVSQASCSNLCFSISKCSRNHPKPPSPLHKILKRNRFQSPSSTLGFPFADPGIIRYLVSRSHRIQVFWRFWRPDHQGFFFASTKGSLHEGCEPGGTPPCGSPGGSQGPVTKRQI